MVARPAFSLVEVIVAITLLSVGLLSVAGGGMLASRLLRESELQEELLHRASSLLDSLIANRLAGSGVLVAQDRYRVEWQASEHTVDVRAVEADSTLFTLRVTR